MTPVFCERRLIGFLRHMLEGFNTEPYWGVHRFHVMPGTSLRRLMVAREAPVKYRHPIEIEALTIFDSKGRPVAIEVSDEAALAGYAGFELFRPR